MGRESHKMKALSLLRSRICDPKFVFKPLHDSPDSNYSKLKFMISSSITEACNNSILLLGPRGSGKSAVLELVVGDLLVEYPDMISVIKLSGLLHSDDNCALKEVARQLCMEHQLQFSKAASFDDNSQFMVAMLKECGLAHKTIVFILDEFDQFAQDADQLLEKRVRSRFSHRKLLFLPPSTEDSKRILEQVLSLPVDSSFPHDYAVEFNRKVQDILEDRRFKETFNKYLNLDSSIKHLLRFLFCAVSCMDLQTGFLTYENFETAFSSILRQPKLECLKNCSILELYILVCMKRLEVKEQTLCNFNSIMKEYKNVHDSFQTSDYYARNVCLRAFEHLINRELICFTDSRGYGSSVEFRPVKLLISSAELHQGLKAYHSCPAILHKLMDREG
ncbi:origin of replication complex subunit 4-like isoform X2 [Neltuma alba]|uniref:origin of replication complex subunit 4-like isoform X2 n=1 Tax=Neltuma alba TaxID=207710 RepID=UPI0010A506A9|nr:origin of replication complex subunit 4-like isoform X2 [Prosopis alba]